MPVDDIQYSEKYYDRVYEYRHVILPPDITRMVARTHLLTETEWRNLGVQQSPGWQHYMYHPPEPHVLLFRRLRTDLMPPVAPPQPAPAPAPISYVAAARRAMGGNRNRGPGPYNL